MMRLRYFALWLFVQACVGFPIMAIIFGLPLLPMALLGLVGGLAQVAITYYVGRVNEKEGERLPW